MLGYAPEELIGRVYLDFVHPDDRAITTQEAGSITAGQSTTTFQNRYLHRNGAVVWLEWTGVVMPGDPVMYCVARDVTQRRAAEEDQAFLAAIVQASHNAIVGVDLGGTIRSWNAGAERLYGYTAAEAIGQPMTLLSLHELHVEESLVFQRVCRASAPSPSSRCGSPKTATSCIVIVTVSAILNVLLEVIGVSKITPRHHRPPRRRAQDSGPQPGPSAAGRLCHQPARHRPVDRFQCRSEDHPGPDSR